MRQVNPEHLEHLARLLEAEDGQSGVARELQELFTRASQLDARGELASLEPLQQWSIDTADDLRQRADTARDDGGLGSWLAPAFGFGNDLKGAAGDLINAFGSRGVATLLAGRDLITGGAVAPVGRFAASLASLGAGGLELPGLGGREARQLVNQLNARASGLGSSVARLLGGAPESLTRNIFRVAGSAGVLRWGGVAGGLLSTGLGVADLVSQGNPITAFQNDPSGYTVDLTGTLSSATMTIALAFPGPGTAIAAGIAAGLYGGALIWDNWDNITDWGEAAWDWTTDAWDTTTDAVDNAWDSTTDFVSDTADDVGETMTGAADTALDAAGGLVDGVGDLAGGLF